MYLRVYVVHVRVRGPARRGAHVGPRGARAGAHHADAHAHAHPAAHAHAHPAAAAPLLYTEDTMYTSIRSF